MLASATMRRSLDDAAAVARALGLPVEHPVVLSEGLNLIVHLAPSPVVARVAVHTGVVRDLESLDDCLALVRHLLAAGMPIGPPTDLVDPGPHVGPGGSRITLWRYFEMLEGPADPRVVGRSLREIHEAAASYPGPLRHVGPIAEIERLTAVMEPVRPEAAAALRRGVAALRLPDLPVQAVHGDAHLGNVITTDAGVVWIDWEESWIGPVAWDLACLDHRRRVFGELREEIGAALAAYGPFDQEAVDAYAPLVALWAAAWGMLIARPQAALSDGTRRRLGWLERELDGFSGRLGQL
jgi:hypothetical protein